MESLITHEPAAQIAAGALLVGCFEGEPATGLEPDVAALVEQVRGLGDFRGRPNEVLFLYPPGGTAARLALVGLGPRAGWSERSAVCAFAAAARRAARLGIADLAIANPGGDSAFLARAVGEAAWVGPYEPGHAPGQSVFSRITLAGIPPAEAELAGRALAQGAVVGRAVNEARALITAPPNALTPAALAEHAALMAREASLECEVWDEARLAAESMTALLAVARGSRQPPRLVILRYTAPGARATLALVGKGVTFDAGGLGLKDTPEQRLMKNDMSGAAAVLGALRILADRRPRLNVVGLIPSAENMPDGNALRTGDVIPTKSGRRVEILDTDCEGRLLLCDTFAQAHALGATHLIDIATLSGACARAFANVVTPIMGYDRAMVERLIAAGQTTGELLWELPLLPAYRAMLDTPLADLKNYGGSAAAAITAGAFLGEFAEGKPWAHVDIAATCWDDKELAWRAAGATGIGARLLAAAALQLAEDTA